MHTRGAFATFVILLLLAWATHSQPGPPYVPCVDAMAVNAQYVFIATITQIHEMNGAHTNVDVRVEQSLKGEASYGNLAAEVDFPANVMEEWQRRGSRLLIFDGFQENHPYMSAGSSNAIDLSDPDLKVLTADMKVLTNADQVIQAVQAAIERHPGVYAISLFAEHVPDPTAQMLGRPNQATTRNFDYYPDLVTAVPVDGDLEQWAISRLTASDPRQRAEAADALWHFPSDANAKRLELLLGDPALSDNGPGQPRRYFVRQSAYQSLLYMGVRVPEPVVQVDSALVMGAAVAQEQTTTIQLYMAPYSTVAVPDIMKNLVSNCPNTTITIDPLKSDFMLQAGGRSGNYKFTIFQRGGTAIYGTTTVTLSNAVKDVCHFVQSPQAQLYIDPATPPSYPQQAANVSADFLNIVRDALTDAADDLRKAANQSDYVQKAIAEIDQALDDAKQAAAHIHDDSGAAVPITSPDFDAPPPPAPRTNFMLYSSLNVLKVAYDSLTRVPGGDFGGYRTQMNDDIAAAAEALVNGIASYNAKHPH